MRNATDIFLRHAPRLAIAALVTLLVPAWLLTRARIDNSIEVWLDRRGEAFREYEQFLHRYGNDEMIIVAAAVDRPLEEPAASAQIELALAIRRIDGVREVISLPETVGSLALLSPEVRSRPQDHALIRNLLLSNDGRTVGIVAWLAPLTGAEARRTLVAAVRDAAAAAFAPRGLEPHVVGAPVLNVALDEASSREAKLLLPVAGGFAAIALVLLLRSFAAAIACLAATAATVLWTMGIMVAGGLTFNMISVALPAMLVVLALSPGIHIASRFLMHPEAIADPPRAMGQVLRDLSLPICMTTITTVAGFASLMVTDMRPVFQVGLFAAVGMLLALLFNLAIVPGILLRFPLRLGRTGALKQSPWLAALGSAFARGRWAGVALSLILTIIFGIFAMRLRTGSNVLSFFAADSRIARDYRFVSQRLTGLYTLELDASVPAADEAATLHAFSDIARELDGRDDVARVDHYGIFQPLLEQASSLDSFPLPSSVTAAATEPLRRAASRFRVADGDVLHLRASVLVRAMPSRRFYSLVDLLRRQASSRMPASVDWNVTGAVLLLNDSQSALVRTQVASFAIAGVAVLLIIGLLFRSWRVLAVSVVPNLLPVLATFALMALLRIPIDPATVMVASVVIGLAVDSTIHFVTCYRTAEPRREPFTGAAAAAAAALEKSGRAIVIAAVVVALGFGILYLSDFRPLAYFGLLTSAALIAATICDLTVTPSWAAALRLWENP